MHVVWGSAVQEAITKGVVSGCVVDSKKAIIKLDGVWVRDHNETRRRKEIARTINVNGYSKT
jgi:hypothetical protein